MILDISLRGVLVTYSLEFGLKITSMVELLDFELLFNLPIERAPLHLPCKGRHLSQISGAVRIGAAFHKPNAGNIYRLQTYFMILPLA